MVEINKIIKTLENLHSASIMKKKAVRTAIKTLENLHSARIIKEAGFRFYSRQDHDIDNIEVDWNQFVTFLDEDFSQICKDFVKNARIYEIDHVFRHDDIIFTFNVMDQFETNDFIYFHGIMKGFFKPSWYELEKTTSKGSLVGEKLNEITKEKYIDRKDSFLRDIYNENDLLPRYITMIRSAPISFVIDLYDVKIASDLFDVETRKGLLKFLRYLQFKEINEMGEISFSILKEKTDFDLIKEYIEKILATDDENELQSLQDQNDILIAFLNLTTPTINKINGLAARKMEMMVQENP